MGLGAVSMIFGLIEYYKLVKNVDPVHCRRPRSFALLVGASLVFLGLFLLFTILVLFFNDTATAESYTLSNTVTQAIELVARGLEILGIASIGFAFLYATIR